MLEDVGELAPGRQSVKKGESTDARVSLAMRRERERWQAARMDLEDGQSGLGPFGEGRARGERGGQRLAAIAAAAAAVADEAQKEAEDEAEEARLEDGG